MSVLGNFSITQKNPSTLTTDSVALLSALATTTASATSNALLPALDLKAPKNNPVFTGTVQGVTANMVTATNPSGFTSNVQTELNNLNIMQQTHTQDLLNLNIQNGSLSVNKADKTDLTALTTTVSNKADKSDVTALTTTVSNKADKTDTQLMGDVLISPKPNEGLETTLSINSIGSGNNFSTIYLNNSGAAGKIFYNKDIGTHLTTSTGPIVLNPGTQATPAVTVNQNNSVTLAASPATADNSTKVATTAYVQSNLTTSLATRLSDTNPTVKQALTMDRDGNAAGTILTINSDGVTRPAQLNLKNTSGPDVSLSSRGLFSIANLGTGTIRIRQGGDTTLDDVIIIGTDKSTEFKGNITGTLKLSNAYGGQQISQATIENSDATGYARLKINTPGNEAWIQTGRDEGLTIATDTAQDITISPNETPALSVRGNGRTLVYGELVASNLLTTQNPWIEREMPENTQTYSYSDFNKTPIVPKKLTFAASNLYYPDSGLTAFNGFDFWESINNQEFIIQKTGIYNFKAWLMLEYPASPLYNSYVTISLIGQPPAPAARMGIMYNTLEHSSFQRQITVSENDTVPLAQGTRVWVELVCSMPSNSPPIQIRQGTFRLHLVN